MVEFDMTSEEGREKVKEEIYKMLASKDNLQLTNLLFTMLQAVCEHEIKLSNGRD